jgi:hypothetical protein
MPTKGAFVNNYNDLTQLTNGIIIYTEELQLNLAINHGIIFLFLFITNRPRPVAR